jgi:hypothetical protein
MNAMSAAQGSFRLRELRVRAVRDVVGLAQVLVPEFPPLNITSVQPAP